MVKVLQFIRSFKTIQRFNQDSSQIVDPFGSLTAFAVLLWRFATLFLLQSPLSLPQKLDLGFD